MPSRAVSPGAGAIPSAKEVSGGDPARAHADSSGAAPGAASPTVRVREREEKKPGRMKRGTLVLVSTQPAWILCPGRLGSLPTRPRSGKKKKKSAKGHVPLSLAFASGLALASTRAQPRGASGAIACAEQLTTSPGEKAVN